MYRFPAASTLLSPLQQQPLSASYRSTTASIVDGSPPPPLSACPEELKALMDYARVNQPALVTIEDVRAWFEAQLSANWATLEVYLRTPESVPPQASGERPQQSARGRRLTAIEQDGMARRSSNRLQLYDRRRTPSTHNFVTAARRSTNSLYWPSLLDQSHLLSVVASSETTEERKDLASPMSPPMRGAPPLREPEVSLPSEVPSAQESTSNPPSEAFGVRLMNRLAVKKKEPALPTTARPPLAQASTAAAHDDNDPVYASENPATLSTIEIKQYLQQDNFSTPDQRSIDSFIRVGRYLRGGMNLLVLLMIFFSAFSIAARVGLTSDHVPPQLCWVELGLDTLCFVVVVAVNLLVPYEDGGQVVFDAKAIARRYASDPWLAGFDVVSNFPALVVLAPLGLSGFEFARVNLLLREIKLGRVLDTLEELLVPPTVHPSLVRLFNYFLYLVLIVTHLSMAFMLVLRSESEHSVEAWMEMTHESLEHDPVYWFLRCWREMLTAIAEKRLQYPHEDVEYIAGLVLLVFALATIAVILASFEEIIVSEIDSGNQLAAKIESTIAALEHRGLPDAFQEEVAEYYERMWEINRTFDFEVAEDVLAELPDGLHADIKFECNARIIRNIPLFQEVASNPRFIRLLVGQLRQIVVMPGAAIVQKGEDGDCMFFLSSGDAAVMNEAGDEELVTLGVGAFFGEVTMLFGGTRDRDILAKTVCVCAVITAEQFELVLNEYPEALEGILNVAVERAKGKLQRLGESDEASTIIAAAEGRTTSSAAQPSLPPAVDAETFRDIFTEQLQQRRYSRSGDGFGSQGVLHARGSGGRVDAERGFSIVVPHTTPRENISAANLHELLDEACLVESRFGSLQLGRRYTSSFAPPTAHD